MRTTRFNPVGLFGDCISIFNGGLQATCLLISAYRKQCHNHRRTDLYQAGTKIVAVRCLRSVQLISLFLLSSTVFAQAPAAPTGLTVAATSETAISLRWTAPAGAVDAYNVFRCEEGAQACTPEWYIWLKGGETTTYTDDGSADPDADGKPAGLTPGATYRYAVLAINYEEITTGPWPEHQSPWSNQVNAMAEVQTQK